MNRRMNRRLTAAEVAKAISEECETSSDVESNFETGCNSETMSFDDNVELSIISEHNSDNGNVLQDICNNHDNVSNQSDSESHSLHKSVELSVDLVYEQNSDQLDKSSSAEDILYNDVMFAQNLGVANEKVISLDNHDTNLQDNNGFAQNLGLSCTLHDQCDKIENDVSNNVGISPNLCVANQLDNNIHVQATTDCDIYICNQQGDYTGLINHPEAVSFDILQCNDEHLIIDMAKRVITDDENVKVYILRDQDQYKLIVIPRCPKDGNGEPVTCIIQEEHANKEGSSQENVQKSKAKKRIRNIDGWKRNVVKLKRAKGEEYVNNSGKVVNAKEVGNRCDHACFDQFEEGEADEILREFLDIGDKNSQDSHLFGLIERQPASTKQKYVYKYFIRSYVSGCKIEVCMKAFLSIYAVSRKKVRRLQASLISSPKDKRGGAHPRKDPEIEAKRNRVKAQIKEHISSFKSRSSHYSRRSNPNRKYLHESLNVKKMWRLYLEQYEKENYELNEKGICYKGEAKLWLYRKIFTEEFNLAFGYPRSDTCVTCDELAAKICTAKDDTKGDLIATKERHITEGDLGYETLNKDTNMGRVTWSNKIRTFGQPRMSIDAVDIYTFDYEKNGQIPMLTNSEVYYSRQLGMYNLGIHDCISGQGIMMVYDETTGKKGGAEVASCLNKALTGRRTGAKTLILFSDGCVGQNKNHYVNTFLLELINNRTFEQIEHKFMLKGHSRLPNDRDFGSIEHAKKMTAAMVPEEYVKLVHDSRSGANKFIVIEMKQCDFFDYKNVAKNSIQDKFVDKVTKESISYRDVRWFSYGRSRVVNWKTKHTELIQHPGEIWCKYTLEDSEPWMKAAVLKLEAFKLKKKQAYEGRLDIKVAKYKDLQKLSRFLKKRSHVLFYKNLPCKQSSIKHQKSSEEILSDSDLEYDD